MALPQSNVSKWCRRNGKQCRPWSDCSLIWVCTVCLDISVWKLRIITLHHKKRPFWACLNNCAPRPQPLYIQCIHSQWIQCIHSGWTVHEMFGKYFILFYWLKTLCTLECINEMSHFLTNNTPISTIWWCKWDTEFNITALDVGTLTLILLFATFAKPDITNPGCCLRPTYMYVVFRGVPKVQPAEDTWTMT